MDERVWQQATPITDFTQTEPIEGQPATEKTEVRLLYDDTNVYVGVVCYDSDPSGIISTDSRRDSSMTEGDSFQMIFDTYHDSQNGFVFGTNAVGVEYDAQVRREGEQLNSGPPTIGRVSGGSSGGTNVNWDGAWEVKTRITDIGWTAEFRIPLRTLRYGGPPQVWGVNFARNIQRKREQVYWAPLARIYNLTRLSSAGQLSGLNLKTPRNLQVTPYGIGTTNRDFTPGAAARTNGDWGLDAKFGVTPAMNLDLSYNTDFAQVEVDEQQINLTRFNLLFPEKRPFFLENAGLFAVGRNGEVDLFFSRRIGIATDGSLVPIRAGARLTGKTNGINVGFLNMQTEDVGPRPANNFAAARVNKDFGKRSNFGGLFVNRIATGDKAGNNNWNRTWATDAKIGIGEALTFTTFAAKTETPGLTGRQYAYNGGVEYKTKLRRTYFEWTEVGEKFNPEVGFLERPNGFRQAFTGYHHVVRTPWLLNNMGLRELQPHVVYEGFWGFDGLRESAQLHLHTNADFENNNRIGPEWDIQWEGLRVPFQVYPGVIVPAGTYRSEYFGLSSNSDRRKLLSGGLSANYGGFLSGHENIVAPTVTVRSGAKLIVTWRWTRSAVELPQGDFVTNLGNVRVTYNFTTFIFAQSLVQYNDLTKRWSTNLRFNWLNRAGTGLFIVYNDTETLNGKGPVNRAFIVKYSRQFDVLH